MSVACDTGKCHRLYPHLPKSLSHGRESAPVLFLQPIYADVGQQPDLFQAAAAAGPHMPPPSRGAKYLLPYEIPPGGFGGMIMKPLHYHDLRGDGQICVDYPHTILCGAACSSQAPTQALIVQLHWLNSQSIIPAGMWETDGRRRSRGFCPNLLYPCFPRQARQK